MEKTNKLKLVISVVVFFFASLAYGQLTNDFGVWIAGTFNKDVSKDIDFSIEQEFRLEENATQVGKSYTTFSLDYELRQWLRFGLNYRFILNKTGDGVFGHRHRVMGDLVLRGYQQRFTFTNRSRIQSEVRTINYSAEYGFSPAWDLRNTSKVNYKINRKFEPYVSLDIRFLIRDAREPAYQGFDRHRIKLGVDVLLARNRVLDLYLMTSRHWNVLELTQLFVVGMDFNFGSQGLLLGF
ncbi:DUF2490 domain-containing protein [Cryomorpha ignava]|uniref:DUF2490 domain-containing protein n=1 Tax=Cryomorpha ignava TaxID=101383 RepID=A0A7K3WU79_9FLAO|nr:DUF2490 domain-containing protein [Cryomorpha ignava]NEN25046.1 DUF2490 domain-containing protein [Cryomorpha ignava]